MERHREAALRPSRIGRDFTCTQNIRAQSDGEKGVSVVRDCYKCTVLKNLQLRKECGIEGEMSAVERRARRPSTLDGVGAVAAAVTAARGEFEENDSLYSKDSVTGGQGGKERVEVVMWCGLG